MVGGSFDEWSDRQPTDWEVWRSHSVFSSADRGLSDFFQLEFPKMMVEENQVKMIVYDVEREVIADWKRN